MSRVFARIFKNFKIPQKCFSSQTFVKHEVGISSEETSEVNSKVSTLYVPGRHAAQMYQILKPTIDIDYIVDNLENLKLSCEQRGIQLDLNYVLDVAKDWLNIKKSFQAVIEKDQEYVAELHYFDTTGLKDEVENVRKKRDEYQGVVQAEKAKLHDIEDTFMPLLQKIPHILHPNTPSKFNVIDVCLDVDQNLGDIKSHTEIAKDLSFLDCTDNTSISYYMTGKMAQLDLAIQSYFFEKLNDIGFSPVAGVDFCKSFIIEAIGGDPSSSDDSITIIEKEDRKIRQKLHLVGGASFDVFCGYLGNMNVDRSTLPAKYFTLGRRYNAFNKNSNSQDLFSMVQSTNVHGLILSLEPSMSNFDDLLQVIMECYSELNIPFRIVNVSAKNLTTAESHRKQFELWSPHLKDYVPVAYVSQHDDFVSKRLQITHGIQHIKDGFCGIVEGTIVNVPILIGCVMENFQTRDSFNIPPALKNYIIS